MDHLHGAWGHAHYLWAVADVDRYRNTLSVGSGVKVTAVPLPYADCVFWKVGYRNMLVGYARCSTEKQDLRAQKNQLRALGVEDDRIYTDHGYTGRNRERPGLGRALAACHAGDTLVVTKLDRLGRSIADLSKISALLTEQSVRLQMGSTVHDPGDARGRMFFNMTAVFAEFEADLISQRTKEGLAVAKAEGKLKGRQSRFSPYQQQRIREMLVSGEWSQSEIARLMGTSPSWISRLAARWRAAGMLDPAVPVFLPEGLGRATVIGYASTGHGEERLANEDPGLS